MLKQDMTWLPLETNDSPKRVKRYTCRMAYVLLTQCDRIRSSTLSLAHGECLSSYDVSALFTSVPVDPALRVIKDLLEKRPHP